MADKKSPCPPVLKDPPTHGEAKVLAIQAWGFGPPQSPIVARNTGFWFKKAQIFNTTTAAAESYIRCSNCEYYDSSAEIRACIEKGESDDRRRKFPGWGRYVAEYGPGRGFCSANGIKVQSGNSCNRFVKSSRLTSKVR